jgi:hypothetical protein
MTLEVGEKHLNRFNKMDKKQQLKKEIEDTKAILTEAEFLALKYGGYNNIPNSFFTNYDTFKDNSKKLDTLKAELKGLNEGIEIGKQEEQELRIYHVDCPECKRYAIQENNEGGKI